MKSRNTCTLMSITCSTPSRITFTPRSSVFSFRTLNCRSFCQSFPDPTKTWMGYWTADFKKRVGSTYYDQDGDHNGYTLYPVHRWPVVGGSRRAEVLKKTQC